MDNHRPSGHGSAFPRTTGYMIRREDRPWNEAERAGREAQLRKLLPDFEDRGGSVTIGPPPEDDKDGHWLRIRFAIPVTPAQHQRVVAWLRSALAN